MRILGKNIRLTEEEKNLDREELLDRINLIENLRGSIISRREKYKLTIKKKLLEKLLVKKI